MSSLKKIYIIGPNHDNFLLNLFIFFSGSDENIIDSSFPNTNGLNLKSFTKFSWNNFGTKNKLEIQSLAFRLYEDMHYENNSDLISNILGYKSKDLSIFKDFENKLNVEAISYILLTLGILKVYGEENCTLIFPRKYIKLFYKVILHLNKKNIEIPKNLLVVNPKNVKFIGADFFDFLKDYVITIGVIIYYLSTIRSIGENKIKSFKIGLLTWANALRISNSREESCGLDAVIPNYLSKEEILIYSKTFLSNNYSEKVRSKKYRITIFNKKEIFKKSSLKDLIKLNRLLIIIFIKFLFLGFSLEPNIRANIPRLLFEILKWEKFLQMFYFDISISYNDYGISDLVRNKLFTEKKINCWSYVHSATEYHLYDKNNLLSDPKKSFINYAKRYYLLPQQIDYFNSCKISSKSNVVIGPLFQSYKKPYKIEKKYQDKIIISVFLCSLGDNTLHPLSSHKYFFKDLLKLINELDKDYLFLFKGKHKFKKLIENPFGNDNFQDLIKKSKVCFVDENIPSSKLINVSKGVISMAFTSPSIEALASNKPAVFYDPIGIMKNNYLENFSGLYLTNKKSLKDFINNLSDEKKINSWIVKKKIELGLFDTNLGVEKIHQDIKSFFKIK